MADKRHAVVIGAGIGGLSAAIHLAASGLAVTVFDAAGAPGGKAGTVTVDGLSLDTGPSVLTMPEVFDELLSLAGLSLGDLAPLVSPSPLVRYQWPDGASLDTFIDPQQTLAAVAETLGPAAERELADFLGYAARIWGVAEPVFVRGPAPSLWSSLSFEALRGLPSIDPLRRFGAALRSRVREPHLVDLLTRYITYAGSDPRCAPATLHCIAHVELTLGGYGVSGGISALVSALVRAAERLGVQWRLGEAVTEVHVEGGRARGVSTASGCTEADLVVSNAEASHLAALCRGSIPQPPAPTSTSGINTIVRTGGHAEDRTAHLVLFPERYSNEFVDLFDESRAPRDPTVYVCAPRIAHGKAVWPDSEPLFVMVNAPALRSDSETGAREDWANIEQLALSKLERARLITPGAEIVWRRDPRGLADRFPGSRGALYGPASDGPFAPMRRAKNRASVRGLYLASGSAHPGGGMPLAALSGRAAALAALKDQP